MSYFPIRVIYMDNQEEKVINAPSEIESGRKFAVLQLNIERKPMLVKHLRDEFRRPFATIVALDTNRIGVAICSPKDHFDKRVGTLIARGRAESTKVKWQKVPNRYIHDLVGNHEYYLPIRNVLMRELTAMRDRAYKYFKKNPS